MFRQSGKKLYTMTKVRKAVGICSMPSDVLKMANSNKVYPHTLSHYSLLALIWQFAAYINLRKVLGCILKPLYFNNLLDRILSRTVLQSVGYIVKSTLESLWVQVYTGISQKLEDKFPTFFPLSVRVKQCEEVNLNLVHGMHSFWKYMHSIQYPALWNALLSKKAYDWLMVFCSYFHWQLISAIKIRLKILEKLQCFAKWQHNGLKYVVCFLTMPYT